MEKNVRLADIYVRIYNKRPLTLEDLIFLAKYDRECFEKTYQNVIYNLNDAKEKSGVKRHLDIAKQQKTVFQKEKEERQEETKQKPDQKQDIKAMLGRIKNMQKEAFAVSELNADHVKNLLGSLYMEMLFPHNDRHRYFQLEDHVTSSTFNKKA